MTTNESEHFGLDTLKNADEIDTFEELGRSLSSDAEKTEKAKKAEMAQVLRELLQNLPKGPEDQTWGCDSENHQVTRTIYHLRRRLGQLDGNGPA